MTKFLCEFLTCSCVAFFGLVLARSVSAQSVKRDAVNVPRGTLTASRFTDCALTLRANTKPKKATHEHVKNSQRNFVTIVHLQ